MPFYLALFGLFCVGLIVQQAAVRERMLQFPFLSLVVIVGYIYPQMVALSYDDTLPSGALFKTTLFIFFCICAIFLAYRMNRKPARLFSSPLCMRRLLVGAIVLTVCGAYFFILISRAGEEEGAFRSQWTGILTIYLFLSSMLTVGLAIALVVHAHKPSYASLAVIATCLFFYADRILIAGRRQAAAEIFLMALFYLWFRYRWAPSRVAVLGLLAAGILVTNSIGEYRNTMLDAEREYTGASLTDILEIDFLGNLERQASDPTRSYDVRNLVMTVAATDLTLQLDMGLSLWNRLVFQYVPGQWVGHETKRSLYVSLENTAYREFGHRAHTGSTHTGFADSFRSFWFFGAINFFLIAFIFNRWLRAADSGIPGAQVIIILVATVSLLAITHNTHRFFAEFVKIGAFFFPVYVFARRRSAHSLGGSYVEPASVR